MSEEQRCPKCENLFVCSLIQKMDKLYQKSQKEIGYDDTTFPKNYKEGYSDALDHVESILRSDEQSPLHEEAQDEQG